MKVVCINYGIDELEQPSYFNVRAQDMNVTLIYINSQGNSGAL